MTPLLVFLDTNLYMTEGGFPLLLGRRCEMEIYAGVHSTPVFSSRPTTIESVSSFSGAASHRTPNILIWSFRVHCSSLSSLLFKRLAFLRSPSMFALFDMLLPVTSPTALTTALTMTGVTAVNTWAIMGAIPSPFLSYFFMNSIICWDILCSTSSILCFNSCWTKSSSPSPSPSSNGL